MTKRQTNPIVPEARPATQAPIPINILLGIPDDQSALVQVMDEGRRVEFTLPGTANIGPYLSPQRFATNVLFLRADSREAQDTEIIRKTLVFAVSRCWWCG